MLESIQKTENGNYGTDEKNGKSLTKPQKLAGGKKSSVTKVNTASISTTSSSLADRVIKIRKTISIR